MLSLCWSIHGFAQSPGGVGSGLHAWWKADAGLTGDPVTAWTDQSGGGFNFSASSGPSVTADDINFNPALTFDGSSDFMQVTNGIFGTNTYNDMFVYIVNKSNAVQNSSVFFEVLSGGDRFGSHLTWGDENVYYDLGTCCSSSRINANWGSATGTYHFWTMGSSTGTSTPSGTRKAIYRDGLTIVTNNQNDNGTGVNNNFYLGSSNGSGSFHAGNIAEVFIYNSVPSSSELLQIHSYLGVKYGITVDQSTATAYLNSNADTIYHSQSGGTHDGYDSDIAGIGRDDNAGLDQQRSISQSGSRLIMDKGGSFGSDRDFLLWGHDGASLITTTAEVHPSVTNRLERVWRADLTGTPGTVSVSFILNGGLSNSGDPSDYALLIDGTDTDFSSGATAHTAGASINGDTLTFTGVGFSDGDFFTLGTNVRLITPGGYIDGAIAWWTADTGVTGTTPVTQWDDRGVGGFSLTGGNGPDLTSNDINYNPAVSFDGSSEYLSVSGGILGTSSYDDMTVLFVSKVNTVTASTIFRELLSGGDRFSSHAPWSDNNMYWDFGTCCTSGRINGNWGTSTGNYHLWSYGSSTGTSTSSGNRRAIYRDGSELVTGNNTDAGTAVGNDFFLGAGSASSSFFTGNIAEIAIWASSPTAAELQEMHTYFGVKYSLTMSDDMDNDGASFEAPNADGVNEGDYVATSGTVVWDASVNTAYHNDVIGIARDDSSALVQKQSQTSTDTTRIYLSSLAASNVDNTGAFSSDRQYLIMGHNGDLMCSTTASSTELPGAVTSRIAREWKITNTAFDGTFSVEWQLNSCAQLGSINTSDLRLLVDTDGDFSDASVYSIDDGLAFSESGGRITVSNIANAQVAINATSYLTLATVSFSTPLPIELVRFSAVLNSDQVDLDWTTASESQNDLFTIERTVDGKTWETIIQVDGAGNSSSQLHYATVDHAPLEGTSYYRLKQTDFNGGFTYGPVKSVFYDPLMSGSVMVYPNPTHGRVILTGSRDVLRLIEVFDAQGARLSVPVSVRSTGKEAELDFSGLRPGIYMVKTVRTTHRIYKL